MVNLAKAIDGFLSSDVGKMAQLVVFAAFPQMKIAKDVAMPVLREFIKKVNQDIDLSVLTTGLSNVAGSQLKSPSTLCCWRATLPEYSDL